MNALKILPPVGVAALAWILMQWMIASRPEPKKRPPQRQVIEVESVALETVDYQVRIRTHGIVRARTRSTLIPQVSGEIVEISPN